MVEFDITEVFAFIASIVAVAGSHFMLRTRIAVLEERVSGHSKIFQRIENSLLRIEEKLDNKVDR